MLTFIYGEEMLNQVILHFSMTEVAMHSLNPLLKTQDRYYVLIKVCLFVCCLMENDRRTGSKYTPEVIKCDI